jgi:3-dehydroquinate synthase
MPDTELTLTTPTTSYPVVVGAGVLHTLAERLDALQVRGALWLVTDSEVFPHYGPELEAYLSNAGYAVHTHIVPAGEASKSQEHLWNLYTWMISGSVERQDVVLALGGGVVGDLAGFAAATVLRGIPFVQLPTTLLAMVDASIGGKTGINHPLGKNLVGAFHQPRMVLADTRTLASLPPRELRAGWAEVIKHGVIRDADLFARLETHAHELSNAHTMGQADATFQQVLGDVIRQAAAVKVVVVNEDEREKGLRVILNYGHTLGHALETALGYDTLLHGEAVAIGMHHAARIAVLAGLLAEEDMQRQQRLLEAYGLPTTFPPGADLERVLALTFHDKKVQQKRIRWVLPTGIGSVSVCDDISEAVVRESVGL